MPLYNIKNKKTEEVKEIFLKSNDRESYFEENPDWFQMLSTPNFITQNGSTLAKTSDGFKDLLKGIKKGSGRGNTINT